MVSNTIEIGNKIDIRVVSQVENAQRLGEVPHIYKSQILDIFENGEIEIMMPTEGGKIILLPLGVRYEFVFYTQNGLFRCFGQIEERYKSDNKYMLRIVLHTRLSKYQRREYYRLSCIMDTCFYEITKEAAMMEKTEDVEALIQNEAGYTDKEKKASVVDLSGGGVRFISEEELPEDSYILIYIRLGETNDSPEYPIVAHVIHCRRTDAAVTKYEHRVEFLLKDSKVREDIIRFIFSEERKSRRNRKG